jgi:protoporphyrin/coproporphyrin ferrochelatase
VTVGSPQPGAPAHADRRVGVLVMAHGTPATTEEIEPFYTSIRRGRPPTPELLAELTRRYDALGGTSPLAASTRAQVDGLAMALDSIAPGAYVVAYGSKHTAPSIEDAVEWLRSIGVGRIVGVVLTPHRSSLGSDEYLRRATDAAARSSIEFVAVPSWHRSPGLAALLAARTADALAESAPGQHRRTAVFFTAHSLPERVVGDGDPYLEQVQQSARDIADLLALDGRTEITWGVAWQSAGRTTERWIGPDLLSEIRRAAAEGTTSVVVCPVGFVSDHLEVLYDLDIEAASLARSVGAAFVRTRSLNDDREFLAVLAGAVHSASIASSHAA